MAVTVYTTPTCGFCRQVKSYLNQKGVPFQEKDVTQDRTAAAEMVQKSGQQGVPVIDIDGNIVVGFDMGRLEPLLAGRAQQGGPSLGARVADAATISGQKAGVPARGAYVGSVRQGSAAQRAGLRAGDVIVELGGTPVSDADELSRAVQGLTPDTQPRVRFLRDGQTLEAKLPL
jgi:glutaredoxin-like YruB-family protein